MTRATKCNPCAQCRSRECSTCPCRNCKKTVEARAEDGCPKKKAS